MMPVDFTMARDGRLGNSDLLKQEDARDERTAHRMREPGKLIAAWSRMFAGWCGARLMRELRGAKMVRNSLRVTRISPDAANISWRLQTTSDTPTSERRMQLHACQTVRGSGSGVSADGGGCRHRKPRQHRSIAPLRYSLLDGEHFESLKCLKIRSI
jgi:hypothetical protein